MVVYPNECRNESTAQISNIEQQQYMDEREEQLLLKQMYVSVEFEVHGKVQGVYFTKYCRDKCAELNVVGWIKNSKKGTIVGKMQGEKENVDKMIHWLSKEGSPGSHIEKCDLHNFEYLLKPEFKGFSIRF